MANTYVKFVNNNLLIVLRHTLYKNSTILRGLAKVFVYETFTDEVIEYLLSKSFFATLLACQATTKRFSTALDNLTQPWI